MENKKGTVSILIAAVLWGIISIFVKNLFLEFVNNQNCLLKNE